MQTLVGKDINNFDKFMLFFIILQPIIDLLTSFSIHILNLNITFGVIIRFGVMAIIFLYTFLILNKKFRIRVTIYFIIFGLVILIGFINNYIYRDSMSVFSEIRHIAKIIYAPIILIGYAVVLHKLGKYSNVQEKILQNVYVAMLIVTTVMFLSMLTGTAIESYDSEKLGLQGWFFAGNEIGAIMAISLPIVLVFAIRKTLSIKTLYFWIPVIMLISSLLIVGTKVGYLSVLLMLIIALISLGYERIINRSNKQLNQKYNINIISALTILILFIIITPLTPVFYNTNVHLSWLDVDDPEPQVESPVDSNNNTVSHKNNILDKAKKSLPNNEVVENILLSGREGFLELYKDYFDKAPLMQKLFGMGYGGNFDNNVKVIEMDFYDIFFTLGIIGFMIYLLPFIYLAFAILRSIIKNLKTNINLETLLIGSGIVLGLGIAYTAGHVLTAPAVSFYLMIIIAFLSIHVQDDRKNISRQ